MSAPIQQYRGPAASWTSVNPILLQAQIGVETDTLRFKIGDGVTHWTSLRYQVPTLATIATSGAWTDIIGKPTIPTVPADIGAQPAGSYATTSALSTGLAAKADAAATTTALAAKADASATTASLAAKADLVGGVIPTAQIPAIALTTIVPVANQAAMLALTSAQAQPGDVAKCGDGTGSFMLMNADTTVLANWISLDTRTDVVTSVNGQLATVVLGKADIGLPNVDNTHDVDKPVSTAQAAAIAAKYTKPSGGIPAADLGADVPTTAQVTANTNAIATNTTAIAARATSAAAAFTGTQPAWTDSGGTSQTLATQTDAYGAALVFSLLNL